MTTMCFGFRTFRMLIADWISVMPFKGMQGVYMTGFGSSSWLRLILPKLKVEMSG